MIRLRELQRTDLATLNAWRNDPGLVGNLGCSFLWIGREVDERWFDHYLAQRDRAVRLAIVEESSGGFVGCVNLTNIHGINRTAEFSIMIGAPEWRGKGLGEPATRAMLRHGFEDLNLNRIYLFALTRNQTAIALYRKVGFVEEGVLRCAVFKNGRYEDEVVMSMLRDEFRDGG